MMTKMEKWSRIHNPHVDLDQHQKLTTSRESPTAHAYHVWSTSVTVTVSYPAHSQNNRTNDRMIEQMTERVITLLCQPWWRKNNTQ